MIYAELIQDQKQIRLQSKRITVEQLHYISCYGITVDRFLSGEVRVSKRIDRIKVGVRVRCRMRDTVWMSE
jgi:hypothetical protein